MKIPSLDDYPLLVPVGDEHYRVCFAKRLKNGDLGFCDGEMKLIVLSRDQSPEEMLATFFHECLHAAEFELGVKLTHPDIRKLEWLVAGLVQLFPS